LEEEHKLVEYTLSKVEALLPPEIKSQIQSEIFFIGVKELIMSDLALSRQWKDDRENSRFLH
jgi:hypothetical protein